jgi:DNA-binding XRE family transcriptional regulator
VGDLAYADVQTPPDERSWASNALESTWPSTRKVEQSARMVGIRPKSQLILNDDDLIELVDAFYTSTRSKTAKKSAASLILYYVASRIAAAAVTPLSVDEPSETPRAESKNRLAFFDSWWHQPRSQAIPFLGTERQSLPPTGVLSEIRFETKLIHWDAELIQPRRLSKRPANFQSDAFRAFTELRQWLRLSVPETASLVGVRRTTPNAWERDGREPRPATARRLYQLHALVGSLIRRLGPTAGFAWLHSGSTPPISLLEPKGDIGSFARAIEHVVFGERARVGPAPGSDIPTAEDAVSVPVGGRRRPVEVRNRT